MGADAWAECPKCAPLWKSKRDLALEMVSKTYGKVSAAEYQVAFAAANSIEHEDTPTTLREDYEQGIYNGEYFVCFRATCQACGWDFVFDHKQKVKI